MLHSGGDERVTCIACGEDIPRERAREYDKHGDRWDRRDKEFEHLCKPCYRELCHQPRERLEARLVAAGAGERDQAAFLAAYTDGAHAEDSQERER
ncbi:MAG: hypothetical protein V5A55_05470 [Halovenus sp.]